MTSFDAKRYKETTREQWQAAAEAWNRWDPTIARWVGPATEQLIDMMRVKPGDAVLDVAAGSGSQSLRLAARVGAKGRVVATDISSNILEFARANARAAGFSNVEIRVVDGEELAVDDSTFDAVMCRLGLMYFPDRDRSLTAMRRALRPGGRVGGMVFTTPERNQFFSIPLSVIRRHAGLPAPAPGQPGPFSLGSGLLEEALAQAGLREIESRIVPAPLRLASAAEFLKFEKESFGALHQMLADLEQAQQDAAWAEIEREFRVFERDGVCELSSEVVIATGMR
jgi:ubiquinone/menaquinone biosynthesis C-methylase UbiE